MSKDMKSRKGLEIADENLENVGGGWHIIHLNYSLNGPSARYHIIDSDGVKVGNTAYTLNDAYLEAARLGLRPEDEKSEKEEPLKIKMYDRVVGGPPAWWRERRKTPLGGSFCF